MPVTAAYMIARGFDAATANGTCQFHTEASIQRLLDTRALCEAVQQASAQAFFGADWGVLTINHYTTYAGINSVSQVATLRQLGGKKALPLLATLLELGYITVAQDKYSPTEKGKLNYRNNQHILAQFDGCFRN